jgi:hypothetical protein
MTPDTAERLRSTSGTADRGSGEDGQSQLYRCGGPVLLER